MTAILVERCSSWAMRSACSMSRVPYPYKQGGARHSDRAAALQGVATTGTGAQGHSEAASSVLLTFVHSAGHRRDCPCQQSGASFPALLLAAVQGSPGLQQNATPMSARRLT